MSKRTSQPIRSLRSQRLVYPSDDLEALYLPDDDIGGDGDGHRGSNSDSHAKAAAAAVRREQHVLREQSRFAFEEWYLDTLEVR
jgi:hypothetical protein